jgi:ribose transport system substrate-binding protein
LGGILRPNGNALTGEISKQVLQDYHVQTAFVSCSGFTVEQGFFESSLQEAQMKTLMLQAAERCVALLDSSKIGNIGLTAFAPLADIDYFVTDEKIKPQSIEQIRATNTHVIVCADQTTQTYAPVNTRHRQTRYRIGFANLTEHTPFSRDVRRGLERAAQFSNEVELIIADNQLDPQIALQVADEFIVQNVDLVIEYQIDETIGNLIAHRFQQARLPVIAVDIPMVGAVYFGVDNYVAGKMAGVELGKAIQKKWQGDFDYLIVIKQQRAGSLPAMRIQGQLDGVEEMVLRTPDQVLEVDSDNTFEGTYAVMKTVFSEFSAPARIAVICFNDDAAVGTLYAAQETGFADNLLLAGQGADRRLRAEMRKESSPVVGSTAYRPEDYGSYLIALALDILSGKQVPPAVYMEHFFVKPDNVDRYYPLEAKD